MRKNDELHSQHLNLVRLGKTMSYALRHNPAAYSIELDEHGYIKHINNVYTIIILTENSLIVSLSRITDTEFKITHRKTKGEGLTGGSFARKNSLTNMQ